MKATEAWAIVSKFADTVTGDERRLSIFWKKSDALHARSFLSEPKYYHIVRVLITEVKK